MNKFEALQFIHDNTTFTRDGIILNGEKVERQRVIESFLLFGIIVLPSQLYHCKNFT